MSLQHAYINNYCGFKLAGFFLIDCMYVFIDFEKDAKLFC